MTIAAGGRDTMIVSSHHSISAATNTKEVHRDNQTKFIEILVILGCPWLRHRKCSEATSERLGDGVRQARKWRQKGSGWRTFSQAVFAHRGRHCHTEDVSTRTNGMPTIVGSRVGGERWEFLCACAHMRTAPRLPFAPPLPPWRQLQFGATCQDI